jgi:RNA polymerase sigma factor (sigma-70 family)
MTNDPSDDRSLAALVLRRGDEHAFRVLFDRHTPMLSLFVRRIVGDQPHDVDDIVQETWIRAVESLERFRWESSFRSWLLGIALNVSRHELRRSQRVPLHDDAACSNGRAHAERVDLEHAISALPDGFRTVLVLFDIYGFTHEQIGTMLGIAPGTSKSQLSRARAAVRARLGSSYMELTHECT